MNEQMIPEIIEGNYSSDNDELVESRTGLNNKAVLK